MFSLFENVKDKVIAAKQHFKKGARSYLEIVFANQSLLKEYVSNGNVPLGNKNQISDLIQEAFEDIGDISSIKPLLIEGTPYLTNQWIVIFKNTDDPNLESKIPRFTQVGDNKEEPTITKVQEELPKENIPVSNLEENPKENTETLANLDTMMISTEEATKKNDETDDKLKSLHI
ncbi:23025_t:CDS:2 [Dentiscutata erythropus]|uniref:23025_t:CDS:1 n=1 Tax=Dentiscutata erythropus TaxID=1348616 RepID=A0A9N9ERT6_9GLOM|nr:23025_t:CDS:2 [Dentiscutata erythropus]